jgi:hypothetical protein
MDGVVMKLQQDVCGERIQKLARLQFFKQLS